MNLAFKIMMRKKFVNKILNVRDFQVVKCII